MPSLKLLLAGLLAGQVTASPLIEDRQYDTNSVDTFIRRERPIALQGILNNIGPNGALDSGADSGVIIASPSTVNPNYLYTWTRDSALTIRTIIDELINGNRRLQSTIDNYVKAQAYIQTINNPSGSFFTGAGLGEPKYLISKERFNGNWGRPQRDGPALRAIALMEYIGWLTANGKTRQARDVVWPVVANDLAYVGQYWNQTGFDLWEEVRGSSFFTLQAQHRALAQGSRVAAKLGKQCAACKNEAPNVLCFLQTFWNGKTIVANINTQTQRNGADAENLLGPISNFDVEAPCDSPTFQPCNSKVLASHKVLVDSFRSIYAINNGRAVGQPAAVGRYSEDVYYNGNPWYLTTLSAAEVLYTSITQWNRQGKLTIDNISLAFFKDLVPGARTGTYRRNSREFKRYTGAVKRYADGFVSVVEEYTPQNGSLSEQFERTDGYPLSAYDLTWSYASFVTMSQRRAGQNPPSWGAQRSGSVPATCVASSTKGTYTPATAAGAPVPPGGGCTVSWTFNVNASTYFGENIYLVGNTSDTGLWDPANSLPLDASGYTDQRPLWTLTADLVAEQAVSYVYARQQSDGTTYLYETVNRTLPATPCGGTTTTREEAFVGPAGTPPAKL